MRKILFLIALLIFVPSVCWGQFVTPSTGAAWNWADSSSYGPDSVLWAANGSGSPGAAIHDSLDANWAVFIADENDTVEHYREAIADTIADHWAAFTSGGDPGAAIHDSLFANTPGYSTNSEIGDTIADHWAAFLGDANESEIHDSLNANWATFIAGDGDASEAEIHDSLDANWATFVAGGTSEALDSVTSWGNLINVHEDSITSWANEVNAATDTIATWTSLVNEAKDSVTSWANEVNAATDSLSDWTSLVNAAKDSLTSWADEVNTNTDYVAVGHLPLAGGTMSGNITMPDDGWIGLGAEGGVLLFDNQTTDEIIFNNTLVGINNVTPDSALSVTGAGHFSTNLLVDGYIAAAEWKGDVIADAYIHSDIARDSEIGDTIADHWTAFTAGGDPGATIHDSLDANWAVFIADENDTVTAYRAAIADTIADHWAAFISDNNDTVTAYRAAIHDSLDANWSTFIAGDGNASEAEIHDSLDANWAAFISDNNDYPGDSVYNIYVRSKSRGFTVNSIDDTYDFKLWKTPVAITIDSVFGQCSDGTNVIGGLDEYDWDYTDLVAVVNADWTFTPTYQPIGSFSNAGIAAKNHVRWHTTSVSGTVTFFDLTIWYHED